MLDSHLLCNHLCQHLCRHFVLCDAHHHSLVDLRTVLDDHNQFFFAQPRHPARKSAPSCLSPPWALQECASFCSFLPPSSRLSLTLLTRPLAPCPLTRSYSGPGGDSSPAQFFPRPPRKASMAGTATHIPISRKCSVSGAGGGCVPKMTLTPHN